MSPRDKVLIQAGAVVQAWRRCMSTSLPQGLDSSIQALRDAIEHMNSQAKARASDPETSRQGPSSLHMNETRSRILKTLQSRPLTDLELVQAMDGRLSASSIRSRRAELVVMGLVRDSGNRRRSKNGRLHTVWQTT